MKPGQIVFIYSNPLKMEGSPDQAKLIRFIADHGRLQEWTVEFTDQEGQYYNVLIKKT